jgi:hypothetical protein
MRTRRTGPCILNLGPTWRWVVSFMHWLLYTQGKSARCTLDRRLAQPQSHSWHCGEEKKSLTNAGNWTPIPWSPSPQPSYYTKWATPALNINVLHIDMFYKREIPTFLHSIHHRRPCGPQSQSGCSREEKNLLPLIGITIQTLEFMQAMHLQRKMMNGGTLFK